MYTFTEVNLPAGYVGGYSNNTIAHTAGNMVSYPDWTFPNIITFDLAVDKTGPTSAYAGTSITYTYSVTNAGPASVKPTISDDKCSPLTYVSGDTDKDGLVDKGETWTYKCTYQVTEAAANTTIKNTVTVDDVFEPAPGWYLGGDRNLANNKDTWSVWVNWYGCTPGFWKQSQKFSKWPAGYLNTDLVASKFTIPSYLLTSGKLDLYPKDGKADTLLNALGYPGDTSLNGGAQILLRAAVAALLNEASFGSKFPPYASVTDLKNAVNTALASQNRTTMINLATTLDKWNNGYCPY